MIKKAKGTYITISALIILSLALIGYIIYQNIATDAMIVNQEQVMNASNELKNEIDLLKQQLESALEENELMKNSDELYRVLNERYVRLEEYLNGMLSAKDDEIELLKSKLSLLNDISDIDFNGQLDVLMQIEDLLANPPEHITSEYVTDENGNTIKQKITVPGEISLAYYDLTLGFEYSFNADALMDPASMIKAPFALSLLIAASEEEDAIQRANLSDPTRVFDMDKTITYTRAAYFREGSGEIVNSSDGTVYTYRELFYHLLHCSDNVAYWVLLNEYGNDRLISLARSIGADSLLDSQSTFTASDGIKILKAIYEFTESDAYYASFMKQAMMSGRHTLLISDSVSPTPSAHKYGWDTDAYCDMGIVYTDAPYLVIIMTNYDEGDPAKISYLQSILKLIHGFHNNFYG